jgi:hypothetical protein
MNSLGEIDLVIIKYRVISLNIMEIWKSSSLLVGVVLVEVEIDPLLLLLDIKLHRFDSIRSVDPSNNPASPSSSEMPSALVL